MTTGQPLRVYSANLLAPDVPAIVLCSKPQTNFSHHRQFNKVTLLFIMMARILNSTVTFI